MTTTLNTFYLDLPLHFSVLTFYALPLELKKPYEYMLGFFWISLKFQLARLFAESFFPH
jgi:hypothetical protein